VVERFIEEKDLLLTMEAVVALHNRYSDRTKRAKSRIKFLVDRFGAEGFVEKYREELSRTRDAMAQKPYPRGEWNGGVEGDSPGPGAPRTLFAQKQPGLRVVPLSVPLGNLSATQLRGLAGLLNEHGLTEIRTTQDQNLLVPDVPAHQVERLLGAASRLGFGLPQSGDNVVACPGTSTCRLGITSSTIVAPKLSGGRQDLRIRVSGCHNGCAQPETGDIGIYGEGRRLHGKLVPHYQTYFGGNGTGGGRLAVKGPSVPTARVETVIARVSQAFDDSREPCETFSSWAHRQAPDYFQKLLADLTEVRPEDVLVLARDHGDEADFRVLQLGGGECAGATQVQIGSAFFEAAHERGYRDALLAQQKLPEAAACAAAIGRLIGQGLTQLFGGKKAESLALQAEELRRAAPDHAELADMLAQFDAALGEHAVASADAQQLRILFGEIDAWTLRAARASVVRDPQLDLSGALPKAAAAQPLRFFRTVVA
jgi:sulfite reductase (NADPH) hemoprotein beta-component